MFAPGAVSKRRSYVYEKYKNEEHNPSFQIRKGSFLLVPGVKSLKSDTG